MVIGGYITILLLSPKCSCSQFYCHITVYALYNYMHSIVANTVLVRCLNKVSLYGIYNYYTIPEDHS